MSTVTAVPIPPTRRRYLVWLWVGIAAALIGAAALAFQGDDFLARNARGKGVVTTASGLQYVVLAPGKGPRPTDTDVALVNYEGKLLDGTTFDKSQQPTPFPISSVVKGFSEGLKLMPKGAKYRFWIKPELGYGAKAAGPIPANSILVFDVELLDFIPEAVLRQMQMQQQMMGQPGAGGPSAGGPSAGGPGAGGPGGAMPGGPPPAR